jgi:ParB family chromosome partitioning protein
MRVAMHPADQFEAFKKLIDQGQDIEAIATRFGASTKTVRQRLKLANVNPKLVMLYRGGSMTLEHLMAFTISDNHARQESVWASRQEHFDTPCHIREALTENQVTDDDPRALFVGDAYVAAGGTTNADLFEDATYLTDVPLLDRLAIEKLQAAAKETEAEGWGSVEVYLPRNFPETAPEDIPGNEEGSRHLRKRAPRPSPPSRKLAAVSGARGHITMRCQPDPRIRS